MYPRAFGACDNAATDPLQQCGITNIIYPDEGLVLPSTGIVLGMVDGVTIPNSYIFDGTESAMLPVDGTVVNNLLINNSSFVFSMWVQVDTTTTSYFYCMGRVQRNYRNYCIYYRGNGTIDLWYQRRYDPDTDARQAEIRQAIRVAFNPTSVTVNDGLWHFFKLQLTYGPSSITAEMSLDSIPMELLLIRQRDGDNVQTVFYPPTQQFVAVLPFRPDPVDPAATDMVAFIGARHNKPGFNLHGKIGRILIFPYINSTQLKCYTSCNELLFLSNESISDLVAITTSCNGVYRQINFQGLAPISSYTSLLREVSYSASDPRAGDRRYVLLNVSSYICIFNVQEHLCVHVFLLCILKLFYQVIYVYECFTVICKCLGDK